MSQAPISCRPTSSSLHGLVAVDSPHAATRQSPPCWLATPHPLVASLTSPPPSPQIHSFPPYPPSQRAPTSFNLQPYKVIVVKSPKAREQLASCMLGPNKRRVITAPVTAVFAADLEPTRLVSRLIEMERKRGTPEAYLANLPFQVDEQHCSGCDLHQPNY